MAGCLRSRIQFAYHSFTRPYGIALAPRPSQVHFTTNTEIHIFDHVVFSVSNYEQAKTFFLDALKPLGVGIVSEGPLGIELCRPGNPSSLCIRRKLEKTAHLHLAFTADTCEQVDQFYRAALAAGGKDNGAPGLRPQYHANYYAAFVIGPDGHNIEAVCHKPGA